MTRQDEPPGDICQILCLMQNGQTPVTCIKQDPGIEDGSRIQRRIHHIKGVEGKRDRTKLAIINKMENWLFQSGKFNQQRFSDALRKSQGSNWQCCGSSEAAATNRDEDTAEDNITVENNITAKSQSADQTKGTAEEGSITVSTSIIQSQATSDKNIAAGKNQCISNWKITEPELVSFFTNVPSGNTWRQIGKFAGNAPDWERAKDALLQARTERMKSRKKRVSSSKSWTPADAARALEIYKIEPPVSRSPSASRRAKNSRVLETHHGPGVQEEANADAHENLSERTYSPERSRSPSSDRRDDSDFNSDSDSYTPPAEVKSPSEWYAAPKNAHLAAPQPKRRRVLSSRVLPYLDSDESMLKESIQKVRTGEPIPQDAVHATLNILCDIVGEGVTVAELDDPQAFDSLDGQREGQRLIPLQYSDRWALVVMSTKSKDVRVFEPQPSQESLEIVKSSILSRTNAILEGDIVLTAPMLQGEEGSQESGVLLIVAAFCLTLRLEFPSRVDFNFWRHVIYALCWSWTTDNDGSFSQPSDFETKISIGRYPESLTPSELTGHLKSIKEQAQLALRRVELTSASVRSVLKICEHLESYDMVEDQEDIAERLQSVRYLCQMVHTTMESEERELKEVIRNFSG